jgi:molybdopterin molybdotransferase
LLARHDVPVSTDALSIAQARRLIAAAVTPLSAEPVHVTEARGRALAEDIHAGGDVPPFANSAMDGFAVTSGPPGRTLPVVGESRAGVPASVELAPGQAIRIATGAVLPTGADCVIPREQAREHVDLSVTLDVEAVAGMHVRGAGEDLRAGDLVLARGRQLEAAELGLAVAAGSSHLRCARRPRVVIASTGDELREPGEPLSAGQIHNSNAVTLTALAEACGAVVRDGGRVSDDRTHTERILGQALQGCDVLVVSGGVSVGSHDHVRPALAALGVQERFWRVSLRPGRPTWFGAGDGSLVFGLPGNPVSAMVTFLLFVRPALAALQGLTAAPVLRVAILDQAVPRRADRDEAVRVALRETDGGARAVVTGPQGSHQLSSMLEADALLLVRAGDGQLAAGTAVQVEMI